MITIKSNGDKLQYNNKIIEFVKNRDNYICCTMSFTWCRQPMQVNLHGRKSSFHVFEVNKKSEQKIMQRDNLVDALLKVLAMDHSQCSVLINVFTGIHAIARSNKIRKNTKPSYWPIVLPTRMPIEFDSQWEAVSPNDYHQAYLIPSYESS